MSKQFWGVVAAVIVVFIAIFALSGDKTNKSSSSKTNDAKLSQHIEGNTASTVKLVEYGDFQCPYCQQYYPTVQTVVETYKDRISFQFLHFPLVNNHPNAFAAARAAEAASLQNKFWEMHSVLYSSANWQSWTASSRPTSLFDSYAQQLGLDLVQFKKDYASSKVNDTINADMKSGTELGVSGTPSFFLNGKQIQVANSVEAFKKVIDAELAKQKSATSSDKSK
jgi:protein-disulfide isomerase